MLRSWRDSSLLPAVWLSARILRFILNRIGLPSPYGNALPTLRKEYEVFSLPRGENVPASSKEARFRKNQPLRPMRNIEEASECSALGIRGVRRDKWREAGLAKSA